MQIANENDQKMAYKQTTNLSLNKAEYDALLAFNEFERLNVIVISTTWSSILIYWAYIILNRYDAWAGLWYVIMTYPGHSNWLYDINTKKKTCGKSLEIEAK